MKKFILFIFTIFIVFFITGCATKTVKYRKPLIRDINLINEQIDYQEFFADFSKQTIVLDKNKNAVNFKATKEIDSELFEFIDFVNYSENQNKVEFNYDVNYNANSNEFTLSITANTEKGKVIDNWQGTPFVDKNGETDIAFATGDGVIYLRELEESGVINKCGWFSRLFRKIAAVAAIVATVAVVVAVAVVAAPAAAALGAFAAGVISSSGTVALAGGLAAAGMACAATVAISQTSLAVAATSYLTATLTALISTVISDLNSTIYHYNQTAVDHSKWTEKDLKDTLTKATVITERGQNRKTAVYLGRHFDFEKLKKHDTVNNTIRFNLDNDVWDKLENKYTKYGMWILNRAFMDLAIKGERTRGWEFRLLTNPLYYPKPLPIEIRNGYFYSMELQYLRDTHHNIGTDLIEGYYYIAK